jgi:histone deacetylase 1/2
MHKQPFGSTSFQSHSPLDIIYIDVWGLAHITGISGARYYLLFMDNYTKYMWFYPMSAKSQVSSIFPKFKMLVEKKISVHHQSFVLR